MKVIFSGRPGDMAACCMFECCMGPPSSTMGCYSRRMNFRTQLGPDDPGLLFAVLGDLNLANSCV